MQDIFFSDPKIQDLKKQGYLCADMHFHSTYSDGAASVPEIIEKAKSLGIGVAITDHNEIAGSLEAIENTKGVFVIPGIEVKSEELIDVLFYFYDKEEMIRFYDIEVKLKKEKYFHSTRTRIPLPDLMDLSKKYICIMSIPHPYGYSLRSSIKDIFSKYEQQLGHSEIFEAINGGNMRGQNELAVKYIEKNFKGFTGGTDGHSIYPLGNIVTCAQASTLREFLTSIKEKKNAVYGVEGKFGKIGEYARFVKNKINKLIKKR